MILKELLQEAGKVHRVPANTLTPRKAPAEKVADGKYELAGSRYGSGFHATGDSDIIDDDYAVLVMSDDAENLHDYYGVNVLFNKDGSVSASCGDGGAAKQWKQRRDAIIAAARKFAGKRIDKFIRKS